jgi:hypothetical protein
MDENTHRKWDIIFKWIGLLTIAFGAGWTAYTYFENKTYEFHKQQEVSKRDHDSYIFQHQATLYFDATRVTGTLATSHDSKGLADARQRFEQLYWGELVVVEDRRVELAMISFRECLMDSDSCFRREKTQYEKPVAGELKSTLLNLSLDLGACTRESLRKGWEISFGQVEAARTKCPYD